MLFFVYRSVKRLYFTKGFFVIETFMDGFFWQHASSRFLLSGNKWNPSSWTHVLWKFSEIEAVWIWVVSRALASEPKEATIDEDGENRPSV